MTAPKKQNNVGPWLTRPEAAARARVSSTTIDKWVNLGKLKAYKVIAAGSRSGVTRFKTEALDALLEGGAVK